MTTHDFHPTHRSLPLSAMIGVSISLLGAFLLAVVFLGARGVSGFEWALAASQEDAIFENLQALCYLGGAMLCAHAIWNGQRRLLAVVWLILCIAFFGEEIS